jgi:hypothetical protein
VIVGGELDMFCGSACCANAAHVIAITSKIAADNVLWAFIR